MDSSPEKRTVTMQDDHLSSLKMMIECLLKSNYFFGLYCEGSSGIGKTTLVANILTEKKVPFVTLSSYSTPLNFYNCLYANSDKVILLDDCKGIIENSAGISLLKSALSPCGPSHKLGRRKVAGKRILQWGSASNKSAVSEFEFHGRVIMISNSSPAQGGDSAAFLNRCLSYSIELDAEQRLVMLDRAAKSKSERAVYEFLKEHSDKINLERLNYRTLFIGAALFETQRQHWQKLFWLTLPETQNHPLKLVRELERSGLPIEQQYFKFRNFTQKSRRTFFRYRHDCGFTRKATERQ